MVGAVNTVVNKDGKGHLVGHITDGIGAVRALEAEGVRVKEEVITIAGAGGAGMAIAVQVALEEAKEIRIFNQKDAFFDKAKQTIAKINQETQCLATIHDLDDQTAFKQSIAESSIYIDATGVGMKPLEDQSLITDPDVIREDLVVFDVVYSPAQTRLLKFAKEHGAKKAINGLGMMLYQGAEAFKLFTGEEMPVDAIKELLFDDQNG